jgi:hypothetical protein
MGFLSGTANYVATGQTLGNLQFFGQANDAGYGGASIKALVTTGGNVNRSSHAVDMVFSTMAAGSVGNEERMRIRSGGGIINQYRAAINVGQTAVGITSANTYGGIAMIWMNYAGNIGYDLVSWSLSQVTVLSSQAISGGTSSRTYTAVSGILKLQMGGSDTYAAYVSDITNSGN